MSDGWIGFVRDHNISHRQGSRRWSIEIHCPFCLNDTHYRMGLRTSGLAYGCVVEKGKHGGGNPTKLIQAILRCTWERAAAISLNYFRWFRPQAYVPDTTKINPVEVPSSFQVFQVQQNKLIANQQRQFTKYLQLRQLDPVYTSQRYDLRWCMSGDYGQRLIIPIKENRQWYTWTGRHIGDSRLRYKASPINSPQNYLFDLDNLTGGDMLVVNEGWADAAKINSCFLPGVQATALFGKQLSEAQLRLLTLISPLYQKVVIMLDHDALGSSLGIINQASAFIENIHLGQSPGKDPSDCDIETLTKLLLIKLKEN